MKPEPKTLAPIRMNAMIERRYRDRLIRLIEEMNASYVYWLKAQYRESPPILAEDALPSNELKKVLGELGIRWMKRFDEVAEEMASTYARAISKQSDRQLARMLKKNGLAIKFKMTKAQRDILSATVHENVSLIKSIPQKYMTDAEGIVMRAIQVGGDLGKMTKDLQKNLGITKRRAVNIARDQGNKATASLQRARQMELGIKEAIWVHSGAGKHPRPTHVKAGKDRVRYNVDKGWFDPAIGEYILPGHLINCRCTSRPIIPGLS